MELDPTTVHRRKLEFRDLSDLVYNNTIVRYFVELYANGSIVSRDEALFQMISELAKSREEIMAQMVNEHMMRTTSLITPVQS